MNEPFPQTAAEFYARRDDRTNRCTLRREYQHTRCLVTGDARFLNTRVGQTLFVTACNLLSRWCRHVELAVPGEDCHALLNLPCVREPRLYGAVLAMMTDADPFGVFAVVKTPSTNCDIQLHLGPNPVQYSPHLVCAAANGWLAELATNGPISLELKGDNSIGALAAACLSGAQVFKIATTHEPVLRDGVLNLWNLSWSEEGVNTSGDAACEGDVGSIVLIGAGSVGSAAVYSMHMAGITTQVRVIEGDRVKVENFNRSPLFGRQTYGANKGHALQIALANSSVGILEVHEGWWDSYVQQHGRPQGDLWLPLANEFGVRWSVQNNYPPVMVHASTGVNWTVNFGRHIPLRDDCMMDRFPDDAPVEAIACATGQVQVRDTRIDAALPFASLFAGVLIAADILRLTIPGYPHTPNYSAVDFGGTMESIHSWDRQPRSGCICTKQLPGLFTSVNNGSRYANLIHVG